jgi:large subunit ribosomal protein L1
MPNPKVGTVTTDIAAAVRSAKAGAVQFKAEKKGIIHAGVGKVSFTKDKLLENIRVFMISVMDIKPEGVKGKYLRKATLSTTMGPSIEIDLGSVDPSSPRFLLNVSAAQTK